MKVNIYYGGRGLIDDPTLYVLGIMQQVLEELNVKVERFHLHELRSGITALPQTLKSADGIILASTVEWYGIGGYMQSFLDACWLYGDKEKISSLYMCPVVMSTTYGEREGKLDLAVAWEILGGRPCSGICGYVREMTQFENNQEYRYMIEKKTENLYRSIQQKVATFPTSNQEISRVVAVQKNTDLTPQETEQLSKYASDESYVQKQKEDIQELASYFKEMLDSESNTVGNEYVEDFKGHFKPQAGSKAAYKFNIEGKKKPLVIQVDESDLEIAYGSDVSADVEIQTPDDIMHEIISGRMTFQRAFMAGNIKMKGDFKLLRLLDQIFIFGEAN